MTIPKNTDQDALSLLAALKKQFAPHLWLACECLLALFLSVQTRTLLHNVQGRSASTLSRLLNLAPLNDTLLWRRLNDWQRQQLNTFHRHQRGRKPRVLVRLDLIRIPGVGATSGALPDVV